MPENYLPIEDYGIIGNMRTAALVGLNGSIDWLCLPHFDSPSVFGSILDRTKAGFFRIQPATDNARHKQFYWPDTNILITRFLNPDGIGELEDYMPVGEHVDEQLIRRVRSPRGEMSFRMDCYPAFDYARGKHTVRLSDRGAIFESDSLIVSLASSQPLTQDGDGVFAEFTLKQGETSSFVLRILEKNGDCGRSLSVEEAEQRFQETVAYWRKWISHCTYNGRWRESVHRSVLALKLLTFEPTGAIVAAPTCSLPEDIGSVRNWDYRYTWIRDAVFTVYAFLRIGFTEEAVAFMGWLTDRMKEHKSHNSGPLQLMYGIDGRCESQESELPHLEGYRRSGPVRIGNGAFDQLQLDIYGELLDSVYLYNKYAEPIGYESWKYLEEIVDWVCDNWRKEDEGVWEVRSGRAHFVYSKLMCWVCLDRGLRLAEKRSFPANRERWLRERDAIYNEIQKKGWNDEIGAFVQSYGSDALDASNLLMPLCFFMSPNDPRMLSTIDAIRKPLPKGGLGADGLIYRYNPELAPDGLPGKEGTFNMCSFWLVEALTRAGTTDPSRLDEARLLFEQMLGYGNHLGLYAEQTGSSGEALGNFPQAFTHLAFISAAYNLDKALNKR